MADQKVSDLPSLNGSAVDPADLLYIVDSSAGTAGSKKITIGQFQLAPYSAGVINGVTYFDGTKVLASSSALVFDGTNLGVGTSSPAQIVDISKAQNAATILAIRNSNAGATASVGLVGNADTAVGRFNVYSSSAASGLANCVSIEQSTANPILFYVNSLEAMRITGARDVGIGITSVTSGYKLDVNGAVNARASAANTNGLRVEATAGYVSNLSLFRSAYAEWFIGSTNNSASLNISVTDGTHAAPSMTFTSAGNVGVGTAIPATKLAVYGGASGTDTRATVGNAASALQIGVDSSNDAVIAMVNNYAMAFFTNNNERARITSGGDLLVGATSNPFASRIVSVNTGNTEAATLKNDTYNYNTAVIWNAATANDNQFVQFGTETSYTPRGGITYNRAGGLIAYNTTSDYRAKDILGPVANPGAAIDALKVYTGKMKGATQERPMLVAHEAQAVAPYSVTGEKDAVNEDGSPKYQQMDVSLLVPLLIAEVQALRARVAALEAK